MNVWPFVKRQKVLIFGVGSGGVSFFDRNKDRYEVIGFLDNGKCKHGSLVRGIPVHAPKDINLLVYERIIIASDYYREIYDQLVNDIGIDEGKIDFFFDERYQHYRWYNKTLKHFNVLLMELVCKDVFLLSALSFKIYKYLSGERLSRLTLRWLDELDENKIHCFRPAESAMVYGPNFINGFCQNKRIVLPEVSLYRFSDAEVRSVSRTLKLSDGKIILERVPTAETKNADYRSSKVAYHGNVYALVRDTEEITDISAGILINGFSETNYYHLLLEVLSQLQFIEEIPDIFSKYPILLPAYCQKIPSIATFIESVLSDKDIIYLHTKENYLVSDLLYINMPNALVPNLKLNAKSDVDNSFVRLESLQYIRKVAYALCSDRGLIDLPKRIFLGRKPGLRSYNQTQLVNALSKYHFTCIYLEDLDFCQQVELMANAELIVGPTGAAWANIIFAKPEAKALCWMAEEWGDLSCFSNLSSTLNIDMQYLTYTAGTSDSRELYSRKYSIPVEEVVNWVELKVNANSVD